jgi:heat shock protein HslJ
VPLTALAGCLHDESPLDGTSWRLTGWTLSSLNPADFTITAQFADGNISGHSAVNTYGGPYKLGRSAAFEAGQLACTEMAGPEPAMRAEAAYLELLGQARFYKMADGKLTLYDKNGNESLIFDVANE